jgi:hypothetical protein
VELCWGLIVDTTSVDRNSLINKRIQGLCDAFYTLRDVIVQDNWFHQRDFVFLCRFIRRIIDKSGQHIPGLFTSEWLISALRRHFQTLNTLDFPKLVRHFLKNTGLEPPVKDDLNANVVQSLRESLTDNVDENVEASAAHCRYTAVIDLTDSEVTVDLLFAMNLLDRSNTKIISLSSFPEDSTATHRTAALAQIKLAIETGMTLLLINSSSVQSALYDVINRHYEYSIVDGRREAYANISLGSFSRYVRIHPEFKLILHIPASKLPSTPFIQVWMILCNFAEAVHVFMEFHQAKRVLL